MNASKCTASVALGLSLGLSACSFISRGYGGYCFDFAGVQAQRDAGSEIPDGVARVAIDHVFGDVRVRRAGEGEAPSWDWQLACWADDRAQAEAYLQSIQLTVERTGDRMSWSLELPEPPARGLRGVESMLTLFVDEAVAVELENRHGDAFVQGVAALSARTGHGDDAFDDIAGHVEVRHAHGDVAARGLGSGKLVVDHGHLAVADVGAALEISGAHGDVEVDRVAGDTKIHRDHGTARLTAVGGVIQARGDHADWTVEGAGGLEVSSDHTDVVARDIAGPVKLHGSHFQASLSGSPDRVEVATEHGDVHLTLDSAALVQLSCEVDHGDVDLTVPRELDAVVRADVSHGDVDSDLPVRRGQPNPGQVRLVLSTSHGDVRVRRGL